MAGWLAMLRYRKVTPKLKIWLKGKGATSTQIFLQCRNTTKRYLGDDDVVAVDGPDWKLFSANLASHGGLVIVLVRCRCASVVP